MKPKTVNLRVKFNRNWNEYKVIPCINGKDNENQSYYTDEKTDAIETMSAMKKQYINQGFVIV